MMPIATRNAIPWPGLLNGSKQPCKDETNTTHTDVLQTAELLVSQRLMSVLLKMETPSC